MNPTLFVSYAHASDEHRRRVAELVEALRTAGLFVVFDGDVCTPQGPPEGWPRWMLDELEAADWVLIVCEEVYYRRIRGREAAGVGLGVRWEGAVIQLEIYSQGTLNAKFIPVLLEGARAEHIPEPLRGATRYHCPADLQALITALRRDATGSDTPAAPGAVGRVPPRVPPHAASGKPRAGRARSGREDAASARIRHDGWLALGACLGAMALVVYWLLNARTLAGRWESAAVYYLILVVLGAAVGVLLFGALRSLGRYRGDVFRGRLELGGPVVAWALVVLGGARVFPPSAANFPLTIYVHGQAGPAELISGKVGYMLLDLGGDRRREAINDKGQAVFTEIPASFRGQVVNVLIESDTYELVQPVTQQRLDRGALYLPVRRKAGRVVGHVQDEAGRPVAGAEVSVAGLSSRTGTSGRFEFAIPGDRMAADLMLDVRADGFVAWHGSVLPDANPPVVELTREQRP